MRPVTTDQQWHAWRRGGVGGSDVAALIGLSRYASPTSLFYEKVGLLDGDHDDSPRQRIGKRMEQVLAAEFHDETGLYVAGEQTWCQHPEFGWARCTLDGYVFDHAGELPVFNREHVSDVALGVVEFKTDGRFGWPDGVPANIRAQTVWQMGVTGLRHCWLVVMFAGFRVEVFELDWDVDAESDWEFMLDTAHTFWNRVLAGSPPPADDHPATTSALTEVFTDPDGLLEASDDDRGLVGRLQLAKARTKAAQVDEARLGNELRAVLGGHTDLVHGTIEVRNGVRKPVVIASWREQTSARIDTTALRANEPDIADKYTTTTTTRVLRVPTTLKEI